MFITDQLTEEYCLRHSDKESELLQQINRATHTRTLAPRMLSGHLQGNLLRFISKMLRPKTILEIGTFTGYSAVCLAEGLQPDGMLYTIDSNDELEGMVRGFFGESEQKEKITFILANAMDELPKMSIRPDLVFIDADKRNYHSYYHLVLPMMPSGGVILADNVLWSGKVLDLGKHTDADTAAIHAFNEMVAADPRVEKMILPVRDGITIIRKK